MKRRKNRLALEVDSMVCCIIVVIVSGAELGGGVGNAGLIGPIAGSFGAGATETDTARTIGEHRLKEKRKGNR